MLLLTAASSPAYMLGNTSHAGHNTPRDKPPEADNRFWALRDNPTNAMRRSPGVEITGPAHVRKQSTSHTAQAPFRISSRVLFSFASFER
ncbi:hypothetical protein K505DRAFT_130564 [Melanomma pulvis-pyrius CBS 109.77]|uniref:Uncharacterized protein n=1 Tax=Melanomma pulvis-pyrius CBS 109.77 TaxID=1314802 RepID=A0A6A6WTH7_9PLEO|nr:hypothetical protein K505DRAFT_130564 [Melanomma pulvis-pyrius CBS 109.77]